MATKYLMYKWRPYWIKDITISDDVEGTFFEIGKKAFINHLKVNTKYRDPIFVCEDNELNLLCKLSDYTLSSEPIIKSEIKLRTGDILFCVYPNKEDNIEYWLLELPEVHYRNEVERFWL